MSITASLNTLKTAPFKSLFKHFVSQTSKHRPTNKAIADESIDNKTTHLPPEYDRIQNETFEKAVSKGEEINSVFGAYCREAEEQYMAGDDAVKKQYERTIAEYRFLRQAALTEMHIMELNRVGVEKDLKNIISQTASHVGLAMPKTWQEQVKDPFNTTPKQ
ncbi:hypothetical protein FGO68_gene13239 [Halteria grandinella]|uniref:Uncharacterized protein n=1 Tax=Halteria grandinella TaxID=5974 RepID=A0A8J8NFY0_HALGN|nr:hypothetical protein FGO68_gene13239 [Halteria grandinella]